MTDPGVASVLHTGLTVADLDRAVGFFRDVLGFPVDGPTTADAAFLERLTGVVTTGGARLAFVQAPGHTLELLEYVGPPAGRAAAPRPCDPGFAHVAFTVKGIDPLVAACSRAGYLPYRPIMTIEDGPMQGTRVVYLRGPDDLTIELIELASP